MPILKDVTPKNEKSSGKHAYVILIPLNPNLYSKTGV